MIYESIPIEFFVSQTYDSEPVRILVENWRIEPDTIIKNVVEHFRELGVFAVKFSERKLIQEAMITYMRTSPEIVRMVIKSDQDEAKRAKTRHAD